MIFIVGFFVLIQPSLACFEKEKDFSLQSCEFDESFLFGIDQTVFDSFDFASSDVEETEQNLLAPPFDVRADNRLWLAPLLVQFGDEQIVSRVAWSAILLRFLVQQQHWSIDNATCVLLAINNRKRQHLSWNNHQVTQWIDSQPKLSKYTTAFRNHEIVARDFCLLDEHTLQRRLQVKKWLDRRRLRRNLLALLPLPRLALTRLIQRTVARMHASAASDLMNSDCFRLLSTNSGGDDGDSCCANLPRPRRGRALQELPERSDRSNADPFTLTTRREFAKQEMAREEWHYEFSFAPEWRQLEMLESKCLCGKPDCRSCQNNSVCVAGQCVCLPTHERFVGPVCERTDGCGVDCGPNGECIDEMCRCRIGFFGTHCQHSCQFVSNMTVCTAFNNVPFEKPQLLPAAELRVATGLITRCVDVVHSLCSDAVLPAKPCRHEPLRVAFLVLIPHTALHEPQRVVDLLQRIYAPQHLVALHVVQVDAEGVPKRVVIEFRAAIRQFMSRMDALMRESDDSVPLRKQETLESAARGDVVYRAAPVFFVDSPINVTFGGISMVDFVLNGAHAIFRHDENAYDFLIPLHVDEALEQSVHELAQFLETKRKYAVFNAHPLNANEKLQREFVENNFSMMHIPQLKDLDLLESFDSIAVFKRSLQSIDESSSFVSTNFQLILSYEHVRFLSVNKNVVDEFRRYFSLIKNPIDYFFQSLYLNSYLARRWIAYKK